MAYSRLFIALELGDGIFALGAKKAIGKCIIEFINGSGKLFLQVQGIKSGAYRVCVLGQNSYADLGVPLFVNQMGRGELRRSFASDNIGFDAKSIKALAVLSGEKTVLIGFTSGKYNWQSCMMAEKATVEVIAPSVLDDGKAAESSAEKVAETETSTVGKVSEAEACPAEKASEAKASQVSEENSGIKGIITEFDKKVDELKELSMLSNKDYIFSQKAVKPFGNDGTVWIKAGMKEVSVIGSLWKYNNNPFVVQSFRKYRHLLLGKTKDGFALGVPCVYNPDYKTEAKLQGFSEYKSVEQKELKSGDFCYCILNC
jgi:hypothetical protein